MKYALGILSWINRSWANRICTLVLIGLLTYSLTRIFEAKSGGGGDAAACEAERGQLIQALIEIKTELQTEAHPTSFTGQAASYMFASFDTSRPQQMQQRKINRVLSKIDSILLKYRLDSLKKTKG